MRKWLIALWLLAIGCGLGADCLEDGPKVLQNASLQDGQSPTERVIEPIVYGDMDQWVVRYERS